MTKKRVLILYYSFSSQTRNLLQAFADGLEHHDVEVFWQQLQPLQKLQFPFGSITSTLVMMVQTSFRKRFEIKAIDQDCYSDRDLIILAGPTWSYNPSGPVLSLLDHCGDLFKDRKVLPFISCRGYWRLHFWGLNSLLRKKGANVLNPLIFLHIGAEPWRTIGVFLKLAGKVPESGKSWFRKYYSKYGHTRKQVEYARTLGLLYGEELIGNGAIENIQLPPVKKVEGVVG